MNLIIRVASCALVISTLLLQGCAAPTPPILSTATFAEAKQTALNREDEMRLALPPELVASFERWPEGLFMSCANGQHFWAGGTRVHLVGHPNTETLFDTVRTYWQNQKELKLKERRDQRGTPVMTVVGPASKIGGDSYLIGFMGDNSIVDIYSFSPCFTKKDGDTLG